MDHGVKEFSRQDDIPLLMEDETFTVGYELWPWSVAIGLRFKEILEIIWQLSAPRVSVRQSRDDKGER